MWYRNYKQQEKKKKDKTFTQLFYICEKFLRFLKDYLFLKFLNLHFWYGFNQDEQHGHYFFYNRKEKKVVKANKKNIGYTKKTIKKSLNTIVTFVFSTLLLEKICVFPQNILKSFKKYGLLSPAITKTSNEQIKNWNHIKFLTLLDQISFEIQYWAMKENINSLHLHWNLKKKLICNLEN